MAQTKNRASETKKADTRPGAAGGRLQYDARSDVKPGVAGVRTHTSQHTHDQQTRKTRKTRKLKRKGLTDNQKWALGLVLLFFAIYTLWVCVSYFFTWNSDQTLVGPNALNALNPANTDANAANSNDFVSAARAIPTGEKGSLGVRFARLMVGRGFGVFAIAIPAIIAILGLRLMHFRPASLERSTRVTAAAMILGSVTLGLIFGIRPSWFGSGLGGETGIFSADWLRGQIGLPGAALTLLCLWILLAVYVSRKNISRVNRVGRAIADGGVRVGDLVTGNSRRNVRDGGNGHNSGSRASHPEDEYEPLDEEIEPLED
jgi:S-DNA-T family DNA segregation ATPase FtsK/SpoIIIE